MQRPHSPPAWISGAFESARTRSVACSPPSAGWRATALQGNRRCNHRDDLYAASGRSGRTRWDATCRWTGWPCGPSLLGAASIYLLGNLLLIAQVNPSWLQVIYGVVLVIAVVITGSLTSARRRVRP